MLKQHPFRLLAISAFASLSAATSASAGCCPSAMSSCGCAPAIVQQHVVAPPVEILVVNQGPVYSGPGPYVTQRNFIEGDQTAPYGYPYVGFIPADTYVGGYRDFFSGNSYYRKVDRHYSARYRSAHRKMVRVHRHSAYK